MSKVIKQYLLGILMIIALVHPLFVADAFGMNMNYPISAFFCAVGLEAILLFALYLPFMIGRKLLND